VAEQTKCLLDGCSAPAEFCNFHADPNLLAERDALLAEVTRLRACRCEARAKASGHCPHQCDACMGALGS